MKKILIIGVLTLLLGAFSGCESTSNQAGAIGNNDNDKASVTINGTTTSYKSFPEAWKAANDSAYRATDVVVKLLSDLNAENGDFEGMNEIQVEERTGHLVLDLQKHTIDRGHTAATDYGAVFSLWHTSKVTIKNGTVTGGYSTGVSGGFYIGADNIDVTLENLDIKKNHTNEKGGGIYIAACNGKVTLKDVHITFNTAKKAGAGIYWNVKDGVLAELTLKGQTYIYNNRMDNQYSDLVLGGKAKTLKLNAKDLRINSHVDFSAENGTGIIADKLDIDVANLSDVLRCETGYEFTFYGDALLYKAVNVKSAVIHKGGWSYYDSCAQGWAAANGWDTDYSSEFVLLTDWIADSNGNLDDNGGYGANCFFFKNGALFPREREDDDTWLDVNLNGHMINRRLYVPNENIDKETDGGCIFYFDDDSEDVQVHIMNGTLTGGNNKGNGGAINITEQKVRDALDRLILTNVKIVNNKSCVDGGGIYQGVGDLRIEDSTITGNCCKGKGGGVYFRAVSENLAGAVVIRDNTTLDTGKADDLYIPYQVYLVWAQNLDFKNSKIGIAKGEHDPSYRELVVVKNKSYEAFNAFFSNSGETLYMEETYYGWTITYAR